MVIVSEAVSEWLAKGEILDRYYNPADLFDDVHLVLTNDDRPDPVLVQRLTGRAEGHIHNLPTPPRLFAKSLGYQPRLLRNWALGAVDLAHGIKPDLVRCYGAHLNTVAARAIRTSLGVPYAVSLHINPDEDIRGRASGWRELLVTNSLRRVERYGLLSADMVLPVYESIIPYLKRIGVTRFRVAYNVLDGTNLQPKGDYRLGDPVRVISVGRQFEQKNPEHLIRAVATLPGVHLTVVGQGPLHNHLRAVAEETAEPERFTFHRALDNPELCRLLATQDIFATHTEFWELSKSTIEAFLTGLPVVLNHRSGPPVPELHDGIVSFADNTRAGWATALSGLLTDDMERERLGLAGMHEAWSRWAPQVSEQVVIDVYRDLMGATKPEKATG